MCTEVSRLMPGVKCGDVDRCLDSNCGDADDDDDALP
jgi:hypothetical protein